MINRKEVLRMKNISTLLAALLLSGIVVVSCSPLKPYSPEEWERKMDQWNEFIKEQND